MRFWDASAIVPLLVRQPAAGAMTAILQRDSGIVAWWGTDVECTSAVTRVERERRLSPTDVTALLHRLESFRHRWNEVLPSDAVREQARRILRAHPLRAGDALQLAAAVVASGHRPSTLPFVCLDQRLSDAARREGFTVEPT